MRVGKAVATIVVSSALALTGCSEPDPIEGEPAPKPSAEAPVMPEEASAETDEGAIAFAEHYVELLNYAANTGDVDSLREASDPECEVCSDYGQLYESTYDNGGYFKDSEWLSSNPQAVQVDGSTDVFLDVRTSPGAYRMSGNDEEERGAGDDYVLVFTVERSDDDWAMRNMKRQELENAE